jgi:SAM-dependent methyltransferase
MLGLKNRTAQALSAIDLRRHRKVPSVGLERELQPGYLAIDEGSVSALLYGRLDPSVVAEVEARARNEFDLPSADQVDPTARQHLLLSYGIWLGVPGVAQSTGLPEAQPSEEIHTMARGPLAAAGGLYDADMVVDAIRSVGAGMEEVRVGLDFGCSSGRVVRVLAAAYPDIRWLGCDPNEPAIGWARQNLGGVEFFINPQEPPLELEDRSLDLAYAISVWSHFDPELGLRWFDEMHRVIRPGGTLVFTAHGVQSIAFYATSGYRSAEQTAEIAGALYRRGWWYAPEFGEGGDWGVFNPAWGTSFLSPEWLLTNLCPRWRVLEFAPGRNQGNQDVYVLERV